MLVRPKLYACILSNAIILFITVFLVYLFRDKDSKYFRFGPQDDLLLISIKIDTWLKWIISVLTVSAIKIGDLIVNDIGYPILEFSVYNPEKKIITDFSKNELNIMTNMMWLINSARGVFMTVVSITQVDIALFSVAFSELACLITVRMLLNEKEFKENMEEYENINNSLEEVIVNK
jgi:hypothetical protein